MVLQTNKTKHQNLSSSQLSHDKFMDVVFDMTRKVGYAAGGDNLTANQIAYYRAQEERRHNLSAEGLTQQQNQETVRHNVQQESIGYATVGETARHNQSQEGIDFFKAQSLATLQQAQADKAQSEIGVSSLSQLETVRHNKEMEGISQGTLDENVRHHQQDEWMSQFNAGKDIGLGLVKLVPGVMGLIGGK